MRGLANRALAGAAAPLLLLLIIVGAALRIRVAGQDLFADELATYWIVSTNDLAGVLETVSSTAEISPPLGFVLAWLTTRIELAPEMLRLPALIGGIGSIPLVYAIGARTVGRDVALLAAALTTLSPFMIFYSAEARGYGVMIALVLGSTLALLLAVERGQRRWWVAYAALACLAAYTHYTSIFVLGAQFAWALWAHPAARRPLLVASGAAALLYVPWLPSLKGDLDSPTTEILSALSPFDLASVRLSVGHWALGFPYARAASLGELPGWPALAMVGIAILATVVGLYLARGRLPAWVDANRRGLALLGALVVATPLGEAIASAIGTNVLSTRNLAASWPFLALAGAALIAPARRPYRLIAAALAVAAFGIGAGKMMLDRYERPDFSAVASFVDGGAGGVVVDAAAFTPGPLANFDVEGAMPDGAVFRLNIPEQKQEPFGLVDRLTPAAELAPRVAAAADGEPITVVTTVSGNPIPGGRGVTANALAMRFISELPPAYTLSERRTFEGFLDLQALVYTVAGRGGGA